MSVDPRLCCTSPNASRRLQQLWAKVFFTCMLKSLIMTSCLLPKVETLLGES